MLGFSPQQQQQQQCNSCLQNLLCNAMCDIEYWKHHVTLSIRCPLKMDVNKMFVHRIQLPRKPEPKEVDVTYGKKVKDISCRVKTTKEDWKEREASTNQTGPTRIKIFEGGSVEILVIITLVISADTYIRMLVPVRSIYSGLFVGISHWNTVSVFQV